MSAAADVARATRGAVVDARAAWSRGAWLVVAGVVLAALLPLLASPLRVGAVAAGLYLVVAALALAVPVGHAGMPVVSQGAAFAVGAFATALLRVRADWPLEATLPVALAAGGLSGVLVGAAAARLRPAYVAATTWLFAWLVALALASFPGWSGGDAGLVLPDAALGETGHYELALALAVLAGLGFRALRHSPFALRLRANHDHPPAAAALGVPALRLRLGAIVGAAAVAGLVGGLAVDLATVADPASFGPFLSFQLLAAVLLGGASSALGPPLGVGLLALLSHGADSLARLEGVPAERTHGVVVAGAVLAALALGGRGLVPLLEPLFEPLLGRRRRGTVAVPAASPRPGAASGRGLKASALGKRYGNLVALEGFSVELEPGTVTALVGPNGSGKSTALRLLAGAQVPDAGTVASGRVGRTLQSGAVFEELTVMENVLVGAAARSPFAGAIRSLVSTPRARADSVAARRRAGELLRLCGLERQAASLAGTLSAPERRLLGVAALLAAEPETVLLDELAAGTAADGLERLSTLVRELRARGLAILLVEHNLRLVRAVADTVVVLDAGRTIARGSPDAVARDPAVREAYLGRQLL
jgi:branched-chain amino acid transport system permease protein